ncbi:MAG: zinc metallopeptidase [Candidatus Hydrogenedentes bacterium]|nr:zinc metallopeptidase [Candidatus Hydrogenedentota bacterium]
MPMPMFYDPTFLLIIPGLILSIWAQWKVKSTYATYSQVGTRSGLTGADVARLILRDSNIGLAANPAAARGTVVGLEAIPGELTDHYDPRDRTLRLSDAVYHGQSVAALGIAAHEVGHAIQHANAYSALMWRNAIYPISSISSTLSWPLLLGGLFLGIGPLLTLGILLFSFAVVFTLITLPVEFNASSRALKALAHGGYLTDDELHGARKVLSAAAWTYVAAAAVAILELVRLLIIARNRD